MSDRKSVIVIGGSSGSGAVLRRLLPRLPAELPAAVLVATHMPQRGGSLLPEMLADDTALPIARAGWAAG